jgi:hypothetical protein
VGVTKVVASPVRAILDTGAGPNLVRAEILPEDWEKYRLAGEPLLNIVGAGGRRLRQLGVVLLHVELAGLRIRTRFIVVAGLAAECILGCQFIDRYVVTVPDTWGCYSRGLNSCAHFRSQRTTKQE